MADLQGPKIRVGKIEGGRTILEPGSKLILDAALAEPGTSARVGLDYKELPRDVRPGDTLLLNDGLLRLTVDGVRGEEVHTTVVVGGELSNNKGINKAGGGLTAPALTAKDMEDIKTAMSFQCEYLAVSFPKSATDMEMARQLGNVAGEKWRHKPQLIAKIERSEAIPALESILQASDGIMLARGALAVQVGNAAVPALQKRMISSRRWTRSSSRPRSDGVDDRQPGADARRGERRRQCRARRHRRGDAGEEARPYPVETVENMAAIASKPNAPKTRSTPASPTSPAESTSRSRWPRSSPRTTCCKAILALPVGVDRALDEPAEDHVPIYA
jgi:pyruvate kinase